MTIAIFCAFVGFVIWLSHHVSRKAKSASGYFAAGGQIHWAVNGVSFAGDYLSAASFLGICGLIAVSGYDGFLYSIGYLAGWIVALFVVAEPMKRLGKYTFTDALDALFNHRGIKLWAAIATLVVSVCYLIPQMVGAGTLVEPLLGLPHWAGVCLVGGIVIFIVATAGMASTTYVQFLKGGLLLVCSTVLVVLVLWRGVSSDPVSLSAEDGSSKLFVPQRSTVERQEAAGAVLLFTHDQLVKYQLNDQVSWWAVEADGSLVEAQWRSGTLTNGVASGELLFSGRPLHIGGLPEGETATGPIGPVDFLAAVSHPDTTIQQLRRSNFTDETGERVSVWSPRTVAGPELMKSGVYFQVSDAMGKVNFLSLMLALFFGTAALPHILIRYYTVPSPACARKSTIVAIAAIGFFYILTLFMGLGAGINGVVNPADSNMSAPLLAYSFGSVLFAIISALAFATVLGTVAGLIVAASGAVAHDLMDRFGQLAMTEKQKVMAGKIAAVGVGVIAIILGILFQGVNVTVLVGLAFAVAASANLPAILMILFWKRTTAAGIVASIIVGMFSSLAIILTGPEMFKGPYGLSAADAWQPLGQPGIISIPLSFLTLIIVSLCTTRRLADASTRA